MNTQTFVKHTRIEAPAQEVFAWHTGPRALERLTPPWQSIRVIDRSGGVKDGDRITLEMRRGPVCVRWISEHRDYQEGIQFRDVEIVRPFTQ
jgi:ligand-binding SRPBCC domain-containing protein